MKSRSLRWWAALWVAAAASAIAPGKARADKADPLANKVSLYIQLINDWSNNVRESRDRYFDIVDPKVGLTCKERNTQVLRTVPSASLSIQKADLPKVRALIAKKPKLDSDAAALQMVDAMGQIFSVDDAEARYFSSAKYKDDDCKHGKEVHGILMSAWTKFTESDRLVRAFVEKYSDDTALTKLAETEKKFGKGFHWYQRRLDMDAKALIKAVDVASAAEVPDPAPVREKAAALEATYQEVYPLFQAFDARKDSGNTSGYSNMLSHARALFDGTKNFAQRIDYELKSNRSDRKNRASEGERLIKTYNEFVGSSNAAEYPKTMK